MTTIPANLYTAVQGNTTGPGQAAPQAQQHRPRNAGVAPPATAPAESAGQRAPQPRPVLDLSDTTLTRRDLPRGSLVNIVA